MGTAAAAVREVWSELPEVKERALAAWDVRWDLVDGGRDEMHRRESSGVVMLGKMLILMVLVYGSGIVWAVWHWLVR